MIAGYRTVCDVAGQGPLAEYIAEPWDPASSNPSTDDIVAFIARRGQTVYHPVGTCAMGTAENSVVDPQLKVHGVEGLRVADASVMPRATRGNTNAPTIMIGEKCADLIKESR
jgi:choline dehydrogenase-like flavoprotein